MKGSKTKFERKEILLSLDKIYCVSEFVKKQIFRLDYQEVLKKVVVLYNGVSRE